MDDGRRASVSRRVGTGRNEGRREGLMNIGPFRANYSISSSDKESLPLPSEF